MDRLYRLALTINPSLARPDGRLNPMSAYLMVMIHLLTLPALHYLAVPEQWPMPAEFMAGMIPMRWLDWPVVILCLASMLAGLLMVAVVAVHGRNIKAQAANLGSRGLRGDRFVMVAATAAIGGIVWLSQTLWDSQHSSVFGGWLACFLVLGLVVRWQEMSEKARHIASS